MDAYGSSACHKCMRVVVDLESSQRKYVIRPSAAVISAANTVNFVRIEPVQWPYLCGDVR